MAIYHQVNYDALDGPQFLRLANKLVYYEGAIRKKLQIENEESKKSGANRDYDDDSMPESMSMSEALARSKKDDTGVLNALNEDSHRAHAGDLFEYSKA